MARYASLTCLGSYRLSTFVHRRFEPTFAGRKAQLVAQTSFDEFFPQRAQAAWVCSGVICPHFAVLGLLCTAKGGR